MNAMVAQIVAQTIALCSFHPTPASVEGMLNNLYVPMMGTTHYVARAICREKDKNGPSIYALHSAESCRRVNNICIEGRYERWAR